MKASILPKVINFSALYVVKLKAALASHPYGFLHIIRQQHLSQAFIYDGKDPAHYFFNNRIKKLLSSLTGLDIKKVFHHRTLEKKDNRPEYKFATEEQVEKFYEESLLDAKEFLQMPPVIKIASEKSKVLSFNPELQGTIENKLIFTDISFNISDRKRIVVVRETDGSLRTATWEEKVRMCRIYNPQPARFVKTPKFFEDEYLKKCLQEKNYIFLLDFACAQFEPDDPLYQQSTNFTYDHIDTHSHFSHIYSTRHYGPFCFYLAWNKKIDNLLLFYINNKRLQSMADIVKLFYCIHGNEPQQENDIEYVKYYIEHNSCHSAFLLQALDAVQNEISQTQFNQT